MKLDGVSENIMPRNQRIPSEPNRNLSISIAILNVALLVTSVALFVFVLDRGFDFTDEAYYVLSAWYPENNMSALTVFGNYLNLITQITGRNITYLRAAGLLILLLTSGFFAYHLMRLSSEILRFRPRMVELAVVASGVILSSLVYYRHWLTTPSYILFSLLGGLLVASGSIFALRIYRTEKGFDNKEAFLISHVLLIGTLIGAGGFIGCIGRPTTGLALGFFVGLWLVLLLRPKQWLPVGSTAFIVFSMLVVAHIWWFEGSWAGFIGKIEFGRDLGAALNAGHTLTDIFGRAIEFLFNIPVFTVLLVFSTIAVIWLIRQIKSGAIVVTPQKIVFFVLTGYIFFIGFFLVVDQRTSFPVANLPGWLGLALTLFLISILLLQTGVSNYWSGNNFDSSIKGYVARFKNRKEFIVSTIILLMLAFSNSLGSNSSLTSGSSSAFVLYVAVSMVIVLDVIPRQYAITRLIVLTAITSSSVVFLTWAAIHPYRLPGNIAAQTHQVSFLDSETHLKVDLPTAQWVKDIQKTALGAGWQTGTSLIDLTGGTPGAAVVLAGLPPTTPWLVGGYKGSADYVKLALSLAEKGNLNAAWILTAPKGTRSIPTDVLRSVDLKFPDNYSLAGTVRTGHRNEQQFLWKPNTKN